MERIIWHWTAGAYGVNHIEADAYHFIINRDGSVTQGIDKVEDNIPPLRSGGYAAHTLNLNSYSIGIALDAMAGASERPFDAGRSPITSAQIDGLVTLTARLALKYNIPVSRQTILSHAEVQPTLGVKQRNKWDIMWVPGMSKPGDPVRVGDGLRAKVAAAMKSRLHREKADAHEPADVRPHPWPLDADDGTPLHGDKSDRPAPAAANWMEKRIEAIMAIFGGRK